MRNQVFFAVLISVAWAVGHLNAQPDKESAKRPTVELIVDFADGAEKRIKNMEWKEGLTVLNLLQFASKHPRGIKFEARGSGKTAFIDQIDDLKNQGGRGRNWIYHVNKKLGDRSFAIQELKPGDAVLWKFDTYP